MIPRAVWLSACVMGWLGLPEYGLAAAITLNATGTTQIYGTNTPSPLSDTSLTVVSGTDRYLVCGVGSRNGSLSGVAATWNSVAMTLLNSQQEPTWLNAAYIFGLANPSTGNHTLAVSWTGGSSERITYRCVAYNNVESVSGVLTNLNGNSANSQGNIATASGDATFSVNANSGSVTAVSHTQLWADSNLSTAQYHLSTTASDAHQYTHTSTQWAMAGIRLVQTSPAIVGCRLLQNGTDKRLLQNGADGRILQAGGSCGIGGAVVPVGMMLGVGR